MLTENLAHAKLSLYFFASTKSRANQIAKTSNAIRLLDSALKDNLVLALTRMWGPKSDEYSFPKLKTTFELKPADELFRRIGEIKKNGPDSKLRAMRDEFVAHSLNKHKEGSDSEIQFTDIEKFIDDCFDLLNCFYITYLDQKMVKADFKNEVEQWNAALLQIKETKPSK